MTKHTIEIKGLPEGWDVKSIRLISEPDWCKTNIYVEVYMVLEKTKPREITLIETDEKANCDEQCFLYPGINMGLRAKKIWRVKEKS